jgi:hypothetical protein
MKAQSSNSKKRKSYSSVSGILDTFEDLCLVQFLFRHIR